MTKNWAPLLVAATLAVASPAMADTIYTYPNFGLYNVGQGGEFTVRHDNSLDLVAYLDGTTAWDALDAFQTFCVERTEQINENTTYDYTLGVLTTTNDPISEGTAYLYQQFAAGTLSGYNYGAGRSTSAAALQAAFWYLENEPDYLVYGGGNEFMDLVIGLFTNPYESNNLALYGVQVLRLTHPNDNTIQDLLWAGPRGTTTSVPDGGTTLALMGFALLGIAVLSRRFGLGAAR